MANVKNTLKLCYLVKVLNNREATLRHENLKNTSNFVG